MILIIFLFNLIMLYIIFFIKNEDLRKISIAALLLLSSTFMSWNIHILLGIIFTMAFLMFIYILY
jgi:hypothetical protein